MKFMSDIISTQKNINMRFLMSIEHVIDRDDWRIFLALERDFLSTQDFVDIDKRNANTFSIKYRSIILQACSEIEKIYNKIFEIIRLERKNEEGQEIKLPNMHEFLSAISKRYANDLYEMSILMPFYEKYDNNIKPWKTCIDSAGIFKGVPRFWAAYNDIKHNGKLEKATMKNAIEAMAGLFSLLLIAYEKRNGSNFSEEMLMPVVFNYPGLGLNHIVAEDSCRISTLKERSDYIDGE